MPHEPAYRHPTPFIRISSSQIHAPAPARHPPKVPAPSPPGSPALCPHPPSPVPCPLTTENPSFNLSLFSYLHPSLFCRKTLPICHFIYGSGKYPPAAPADTHTPPEGAGTPEDAAPRPGRFIAPRSGNNSRSGSISNRLGKGTGFTGCGKTQSKGLSNKGTALAGPSLSRKDCGLQPLLFSPPHLRSSIGLFSQPALAPEGSELHTDAPPQICEFFYLP
jgi:hypothetical protein